MDVCRVCDGTGFLLREVCPLCDGAPIVQQVRPFACMQQRSDLCLVLDIDGTLLSESVSEDWTIEQLRTYLRPNTQAFLRFAFENFAAVGIWTAGSDEWLRTFVAVVDPMLRTCANGVDPWAFKWSRRLSWIRAGTEGLYPTWSQVKPLKKIWRNRSLRAVGYSSRSTLIIDNTESVCRLNYGNAVYIKTYHCGDDDWLLVLMEYLKELAKHHRDGVSMRNIEKRHWYVAVKERMDLVHDCPVTMGTDELPAYAEEVFFSVDSVSPEVCSTSDPSSTSDPRS
ncbi:unnamed protein product [Symbiodinium natans]|uniref:Mitochondrial import inner membrane translocase subunit TIM50 n=1 Tax=Symbiodinium natans TaxID=878477 RepID=A0A812I707_9DINO|nr:unnamed protein product [Symbiodinium natans]